MLRLSTGIRVGWTGAALTQWEPDKQVASALGLNAADRLPDQSDHSLRLGLHIHAAKRSVMVFPASASGLRKCLTRTLHY